MRRGVSRGGPLHAQVAHAGGFEVTKLWNGALVSRARPAKDFPARAAMVFSSEQPKPGEAQHALGNISVRNPYRELEQRGGVSIGESAILTRRRHAARTATRRRHGEDRHVCRRRDLARVYGHRVFFVWVSTACSKVEHQLRQHALQMCGGEGVCAAGLRLGARVHGGTPDGLVEEGLQKVGAALGHRVGHLGGRLGQLQELLNGANVEHYKHWTGRTGR